MAKSQAPAHQASKGAEMASDEPVETPEAAAQRIVVVTPEKYDHRQQHVRVGGKIILTAPADGFWNAGLVTHYLIATIEAELTARDAAWRAAIGKEER